MTLPIFRADDDPGPSFLEVLRRTGLEPNWGELPRDLAPHEVTHGTTVVALKFADGVVMAGDRRATSGNLISHRTMEKVFPADRHSGVAIAGAAGPAIEMVKLFQLQLEHYEKVEGNELSIEGKANQLAQMVRGHLPAALQGFVDGPKLPKVILGLFGVVAILAAGYFVLISPVQARIDALVTKRTALNTEVNQVRAQVASTAP